ncbi:MAG: hypothetical protein AABX23_03025 [Nanoarchaeota archaeon]
MSKHAFWQALVFTVVVFFFGMLLGFYLELNQSQSIYTDLVNSELNILDEQVRQRLITDSNLSCELGKESLFTFADKIYDDAIDLEEVDGTGRIGDLTVLHKRYDLLRTLLLLEAEKLKERCLQDFHIVTYLYYYNVENIDISSKQNYLSNLVFDLKTENPDEVILIPIAIDTDVASVDLLVKSLDSKTYPMIIVNKELIITDLIGFEQLRDLVFNESDTYSP